MHNCRCILTYLPSSLDAILGTTGLDEKAKPSRTSSEGLLTGDTTMTGYLQRNPKEAAEILGVRRVAMFRAGKLTLRDLVSGTGRQLTLKELAAR